MVPVVNQDGYKTIGEMFAKTKTLNLVRKNRHYYPTQAACDETSIGVDLNRNYGYMFAYDNKGSHGEENVCADDYRGPSPFSEPETIAMRDFVAFWTNIKLAINFHAYGNLHITPFNFDNKQNINLMTQFAAAADFYKHVAQSGTLPAGSLQGNGAQTILYSANGEASDFMLANYGIYAVSHELGTSDHRTNTFFINETDVLLDLVKQNYKWVIFTITQLFPSVKITPIG